MIGSDIIKLKLSQSLHNHFLIDFFICSIYKKNQKQAHKWKNLVFWHKHILGMRFIHECPVPIRKLMIRKEIKQFIKVSICLVFGSLKSSSLRKILITSNIT